MHDCTDIELSDDGEVIFAHGAIVSDLVHFLDPSVPWVWILGHLPCTSIQWWNATTPLNMQGDAFSGMVRNLSYDLQMPTQDFVSQSHQFDHDGIDLIQSYNEMPETLRLEKIHEQQQNRVLIQNGATLRIYLPHAIETMKVESFRRRYLSSKISLQ